MTEPYDPFRGEINVNDLLEPQPETIADFIDVCFQIDDLSEVDLPSADAETGEVPSIKSYYLIRRPFANGSRITAHSIYGSEEYMEAWGEVEPIRSIELTTGDGIEYEYSSYLNGRSKLYIKKPGERVQREAVTPYHIETASDALLTVGIQGTPDFMQFMAAAFAERCEADRLGISTPTDGSLREFTAALQDALGSGMVTEDR